LPDWSVTVALCEAALPAANAIIAVVNAAMQIRRKLDTNPPLLPDSCVLRTRMTRNRIESNPVACIGHSRDDSMVAQLRIFWCKAQTKVDVKVNAAAVALGSSRRP
jgi:hypothetical protein